MVKLMLIGAGGFIGSVLRYLVSGATHRVFKIESFPIGTAAVNIIGCFLIGLFFYLAESRGALSDNTRAFIIVGILGGFTTFSAFSNESLNLFRAGQMGFGLLNIFGQVAVCLLAVWAGRAAAYGLWR